MQRISILIPCYNAERWIQQCIESALAQTHDDCEVIVVDDGSTDDSLKVIRSFGDRIRFETGPNRGGNAARNRLLQLATGEWVQYLDADDYLLPNKVSSQIPTASDSADVVYSPTMWVYCDADGTIREEHQFTIEGPHDPWHHLILWRLPQTGGALWRKSAIEEVGGWKIDQPCCQEHELYFRLLEANRTFVFSPETGAVYRQWSEETVCRRNPTQAVLKRMEVVTLCEHVLTERSQMTAERRVAIAIPPLENP